MTTLRFGSEILLRAANPYVLVTAKQAGQIKADWKKPMPVTIWVNGQPEKGWHIHMMPVGNGDFYLYLHGEVREASGTKVGDMVQIQISFDEQYKNGPMHPMPTWFAQALDNNEIAKGHWDALSPSRQKEVLRYFSWLKSDSAKQRNLQKVMEVLSGKSGRFMARDWQNGG